MSKPSYLEPRLSGDRFRSTEQQRHVRIWAELWGADVYRLRVEGSDLVGEIELEGVRTPFRVQTERQFGWRGRSRTKTAINQAISNMRTMQ